MRHKAGLCFTVWGCTSIAAALVNIVEWFVKPQYAYQLVGIWNIVDYTPLLVIVVLPMVSVLLLVHFSDRFSVSFRVCAALFFMMLMVICNHGWYLCPEWLMLPDLRPGDWSDHPLMNYWLAWGTLCGCVSAGICFLCAYIASRDDSDD